MQYRVYSGPKGSGEISPMAKEQMLFKEFAALDDALSWARHVEQGGRVPLLIEGDDGTRMDRRAIADALRRRPARAGRSLDRRVSRLAGEAGPLGAGALGQMLPFGTDDVPIDQRPLHARWRVRGRSALWESYR